MASGLVDGVPGIGAVVALVFMRIVELVALHDEIGDSAGLEGGAGMARAAVAKKWEAYPAEFGRNR